MKEICENDICVGCQACKQICSRNAIKMMENEYGHIYPLINQTLCVDCGACKKVCTAIHPITKNGEPKVYAGWIKDNEVRKKSTSGGVAYQISKRFVEKGGVYCGSVWIGYGAEHKLCDDVDGLKAFQGSKYTHSDVLYIYREIRVLLQENKKILFSGTPCQIASLKAFLIRDYSNLYTIDIVCHGIPSKSILRNYLKSIEQKVNKKIVDVKFRDKSPDQYQTCMKFTFDDGTYSKESVYKNNYFRAFVCNYTLRENCFTCAYATKERVGDITLADFWGYPLKKLSFFGFNKGISMIMVNNKMGEELLNLISSDIKKEKVTFATAAKCNLNLRSPQPKPIDFDSFWKDYLHTNDLNKLEGRYFKALNEIRISIKRKCISLLKNNIKNMLGR